MKMDRVSSYDIKLALKKMHDKRTTYFITECKTCSTYFPDPQDMRLRSADRISFRMPNGICIYSIVMSFSLWFRRD